MLLRATALIASSHEARDEPFGDSGEFERTDDDPPRAQRVSAAYGFAVVALRILYSGVTIAPLRAE